MTYNINLVYGICPISVFSRKGAFQMAFNLRVDKEKCKGCEECVEICTVDVFEMQDGKSVPINTEECLGCEGCVEVCKEKAITLEDTRHALSNQCLSLLRDIL